MMLDDPITDQEFDMDLDPDSSRARAQQGSVAS